MQDIYYSEKGSGIPVILIHGFCESHSIWDHLVIELSSSYRVICPDLPGFGNSALPENPDFSLDDIADSLAFWLDEKDIRQSVMIGHSLGGHVTLAFADKYPSKLLGFGLFHSTSYADDVSKKDTRNKVIQYLEKHGAQNFAETFVPGLFYNKKGDVEQDIQKLVEDAQKCTTESLIAYTRAMRDRPDRSRALQNPNLPVLFIAGDNDAAVPIEQSRKQTANINPQFIFFLPETGHMGMFERKAETTQMVSAFLAQF